MLLERAVTWEGCISLRVLWVDSAPLAPELAAVPVAEKAAVALCQRACRDTAADPATQQLWFQVLQARSVKSR